MFSECKTILKLIETLSITYYCFKNLINVHPVIPGSPIENKELQTKHITFSIPL